LYESLQLFDSYQSITILPDRRKSRKAMPRHPKVCCTDNRTQYSAVPLGVLVTITLRRRNERTNCVLGRGCGRRESSRHILVSHSSLLSAFSSTRIQRSSQWSKPSSGAQRSDHLAQGQGNGAAHGPFRQRQNHLALGARMHTVAHTRHGSSAWTFDARTDRPARFIMGFSAFDHVTQSWNEVKVAV
jgi:hypothetical protein